MVQLRSIDLAVRTQRNVVASDEEAEMVAMVSVKGRVEEDEEGKRRKPVDIVVVLDKSGSMQGTKLALCKQTLEFLATSALSSEDRLGLVTFDSVAQTVFAPTKMNEDGKTMALSKIGKIASGSCTNLSGGLFEGVSMLSGPDTSEITAILLLTDGQMNEGIRDSAKLVRTMETMLAKCRVRPSVYTFGYGQDANEDVLRAIAEAGGGMYFAVMSPEAAPLAFSDVVGGLMSVVGQNLELNVDLGASSALVGAPLCRFPNETPAPNRVVVRIRDLFAGESRDIVIKFKVPRDDKGANVTVSASVKYIDVVLERPETVEATCDVRRVPRANIDESALRDDIEVVRHVARMEAVNAMESAREQADAGDFTSAKGILAGAEGRMKTMLAQAGAEDDEEESGMMSELFSDLHTSAEAMSRPSLYATEGRKRVTASAFTHSAQRSNKADEMLTPSAGLLKGATPQTSSYASAVPSKARMLTKTMNAFGLL